MKKRRLNQLGGGGVRPSQAIKHLQFIIDNQQSVSTNRLKKIVEVIASHQKMLEKDNRILRNRVTNQRLQIKGMRGKLK